MLVTEYMYVFHSFVVFCAAPNSEFLISIKVMLLFVASNAIRHVTNSIRHQHTRFSISTLNGPFSRVTRATSRDLNFQKFAIFSNLLSAISPRRRA